MAALKNTNYATAYPLYSVKYNMVVHSASPFSSSLQILHKCHEVTA